MSVFHSIEVHSYRFDNNVWLAPMAGFTNFPFRKMCYDFGAGVTFSEMVSVEGLIRDNKKTLKYIERVNENDIIQIFGGNYNSFYKAAKILLENFNIKILDINFGCPVRKVIKGEAGSFLLKYPDRMSSIVKAVKDAGIEIVSAKIRAGFDKEDLDNIIPALNKAGVDIITLHARLAVQFYSGVANRFFIQKARNLTDKILIANGDIKTPEDVENVILSTGADGVMLGRIAIEKPFIFLMVNNYFKDVSYKEENIDVKNVIVNFVKNYCDYYKNENIIGIRGILLGMIKKFPYARELRDKIARVKTSYDFFTLMEEVCYD
ncbi:MAG: tRNA-dihydrouridine synthase family protein [Brevinematales bacterium]|nr:tRNA-dihydrouridine synthase family protein [Brevinematales bacterium]